VDKPVAVEDRVRADLVDLLYGQVRYSSAISALVATILCALLWNLTPHGLLVGWWLVIALLAALRATLALAYRRRSQALDARAWEQRFLVALIATALAWGLGGWLIMPPGEIEYQAVVYFFLMGVVGGAAANYSATWSAS
jgi:hypothetical protein